jgi:hypothetical protein
MRYVFLLLSCAVLSGCFTTGDGPLLEKIAEKNKKYPAFQVENQQITEARLITDILVTRAGDGELKKVDVPENKAIADTLAYFLSMGLKAKRYPVQKVYPSGVGMFFGQGRKLQVVRTDADRQTDESKLPLDTPPFISVQEVQDDQEFVRAWNAYHAIYYTHAPRAKSEALNDTSSKQVVFVLTATGYTVSSGESVGKGLLTGILTTIVTLGFFTYSQYGVSSRMLELQAISIPDGRLMWSGAVGGADDLTPESAREAITELLAKLPTVKKAQLTP